MNERQHTIEGLARLADWITCNTESAWRNEHRLLSDHDHDYYQKVIEEAKAQLQKVEKSGTALNVDPADRHQEMRNENWAESNVSDPY